jgi:hypothetical protein
MEITNLLLALIAIILFAHAVVSLVQRHAQHEELAQILSALGEEVGEFWGWLKKEQEGRG